MPMHSRKVNSDPGIVKESLLMPSHLPKPPLHYSALATPLSNNSAPLQARPFVSEVAPPPFGAPRRAAAPRAVSPTSPFALSPPLSSASPPPL